MIKRYTRKEMGEIWTDLAKFQSMLEVEIFVVEAMAIRGDIPQQDVDEIKRKAHINVTEIQEIEKVVKHDVIAFLSYIERNVGESARHLHMGMTSSDVLDTSLSMQLVKATKILQRDLDMLEKSVSILAIKHKMTLIAGRSHGIHAEPMTFGIKMCGWLSEIKRNKIRLKNALQTISYGQISGAIGTFIHLSPFIEKYVCEKLGLVPEPVSTQIIPRDRHAEYLTTLAIIAASIERFATEIRHLQRTEVLEVAEPFSSQQKGSSAMPHKRNPILSENICGLSRLIRSYVSVGIENIVLWHERDISHSSAERVLLPDATIILDFMMHRMNSILENLCIYPDQMKKNLDATMSSLFSQRVMLTLVQQENISRESAYDLVQSMVKKSIATKVDLKSLMLQDERILQLLSSREIVKCFDLSYFIRNVDIIFDRIGI